MTKTLLCVFTSVALTAEQMRNAKKYAFLYKENPENPIEEGIVLRSHSYPDKLLQVAKILDVEYTYVNIKDGSLKNTIDSTYDVQIRNLVEETEKVPDTVFFHRVLS